MSPNNHHHFQCNWLTNNIRTYRSASQTIILSTESLVSEYAIKFFVKVFTMTTASSFRCAFFLETSVSFKAFQVFKLVLQLLSNCLAALGGGRGLDMGSVSNTKARISWSSSTTLTLNLWDRSNISVKTWKAESLTSEWFLLSWDMRRENSSGRTASSFALQVFLTILINLVSKVGWPLIQIRSGH